MLTSPTPQRHHRAPAPTRPAPRVANTAAHQAVLATRLTPRDRWIIRMLWEHRVLTSEQITTLAFPSYRSGRQRLRELYLWGVLDRFRPQTLTGSAPHHYVVAPAGAAVLASELGLDVKDLGYRHDRAIGIAHSLRLAHTVGVNEWFTSLATTATLTAWWSETRCAKLFGDLTRPDGYGRLDEQTEFFLEFDTGTEPLTKVAAKLTGYANLAASTTIATPLLFWFPTARREANARKQLHTTWRDLDDPPAVPIATAAANLFNSDIGSPADNVWLPLASADSRLPLHEVLARWSRLTPPATDQLTAHEQVPPPHPIPPRQGA